MKKVLIMVLSCEQPPYNKLMEVQFETWDKIHVSGAESLFYLGGAQEETFFHSAGFLKIPTPESLHTMGYKDLLAYEWALKNKEFDYVARVHSSTYVDKKELIKYVQTLPEKGVFEGLIAPKQDGSGDYVWGGGQYLISRDVLQAMVDNQDKWDHSLMEDQSMSKLVLDLGYSFKSGNACSIDKQGDDQWLQNCYNLGKSKTFADFSEIVGNGGHYFYRVKHDPDRSVDHIVMNELFKVLNK